MNSGSVVAVVLLSYIAVSLIAVSLWVAFKEVRAERQRLRREKIGNWICDETTIDWMERQWPYDHEARGDFGDGQNKIDG